MLKTNYIMQNYGQLQKLDSRWRPYWSTVILVLMNMKYIDSLTYLPVDYSSLGIFWLHMSSEHYSVPTSVSLRMLLSTTVNGTNEQDTNASRSYSLSLLDKP